MNALDQLRADITRIDTELLRLLDQRLQLVARVAQAKAATGASVFDATREEAVLAHARAHSADPAEAAALMTTLMRLSRERQYDGGDNSFPETPKSSLDHIRTVAFGGAAGSFSEAAARALFPDAQLLPARTFSDACESECDVAVLPVANTSGGTVDTVFRLLQGGLHIVRSVELGVRHCLATIPGATPGSITTVLSHPQALAQCSLKIREHQWHTEPVDNTAFAARDVAQRADMRFAAICSAEAAAVAGLEILADNLCDTACNRTRFIAVTREAIITPDATRLTLLLHLPHTAGALAATLSVIADRGLNLAAISSHPLPEKPWEYAFFLDIEAPAFSPSALAVIRQFANELPFLRVVGWYG